MRANPEKLIAGELHVPQNGEGSLRFGVYKSLCCGAEIVINPRAIFPDCLNHPKLTTIWKPLLDEKIGDPSEDEKSESHPAE